MPDLPSGRDAAKPDRVESTAGDFAGEVFLLRELGNGSFEGRPSGGRPTMFGGHLLAQGLLAASFLEDRGRPAHSLHADFLSAGRSSEPVAYDVTTVFDGRSFATRRVVARQGDAIVLTLNVSFHAPENGAAHQVDPTPCLGPSEAKLKLAAWRSNRGRLGLIDPAEIIEDRAVEIVPTDPDAVFGTNIHIPRNTSWVKCRYPLAGDPVRSRAALAYASDLLLLRVSMLPHGFRPGMSNVKSASLDHALWIFDTPDLDDWLLFETESPWAGSGRSLSRGRFFTRAGKLIAEVAQESLIRMPFMKADLDA